MTKMINHEPVSLPAGSFEQKTLSKALDRVAAAPPEGREEALDAALTKTQAHDAPAEMAPRSTYEDLIGRVPADRIDDEKDRRSVARGEKLAPMADEPKAVVEDLPAPLEPVTE